MLQLDSVKYSTRVSQAAEFIRSQIQQGRFVCGDKLPSIREISKLTGVGVYSIQKAIDQLERDGTLKAVPGSGTFVSEGANMAVGSQSNQMGIKNLAVFNAFFESGEGPQLAHPGTISGIMAECGKADAEVVLMSPNLDLTSAKEVKSKICSGGFDGVIWLYPAPSHLEAIEACRNAGVPVVITSHSHFSGNVARVEGDEVHTGFNIGRLFVESGCENIMFFWLPSPGGNGNGKKMSYPHIGLIGGLQSSLLLGSDDNRRITFELIDLQRGDINCEPMLARILGNTEKKIGAVIPNYLGLQSFIQSDVEKVGSLFKRHQIVIPTSLFDAKKLEPLTHYCDFDILVYKVETIGKLAVQKLRSIKQGLLEDVTAVVKLDFGKYRDVLSEK